MYEFFCTHNLFIIKKNSRRRKRNLLPSFNDLTYRRINAYSIIFVPQFYLILKKLCYKFSTIKTINGRIMTLNINITTNNFIFVVPIRNKVSFFEIKTIENIHIFLCFEYPLPRYHLEFSYTSASQFKF